MKVTIRNPIIWFLIATFIGGVATGAGQPRVNTERTFYIPVSVVSKVKDDYVRGLVPADFEVLDGKTSVPVIKLLQPSQPMNIGIVMDTSASVTFQNARFHAFLRELKELVGQANDDNNYLITSFGVKNLPINSELIQDNRKFDDVVDKLYDLKPATETYLYDGLEKNIYDLLTLAGSKKVLFVVTDGLDTSSKTQFSKVRDILLQSNMVVYPLFLESGLEGPRTFSMHSRLRLIEMADITGGVAYDLRRNPNGRSVMKILEEELENMYFAEVQLSPNPEKLKRRKLEVRLSAATTKKLGSVSLWGKREVLY